MKISEMNNEQATEALIRLSVPFGNICEDENTVKLLEEFKNTEEITNLQSLGKVLPKVVTYLLKDHKADVYEIVGVLSMKTAAQVAKMNFAETIRIIKESYDEVLVGFFQSSVKQTKGTGAESSQG